MIDDKLKGKDPSLLPGGQMEVSAIASHLHVHHSTVTKALAGAGVEVPVTQRARMVDPYLTVMQEKLEQYPKLCASRLFQMVKERGYPGREDHFRAIVARYRPRPPAEAYLRLQTLPGEQGQVDWGTSGSCAWETACAPSARS